MGQYWIPVNLDKREFIHPHKLATGLKLREQVWNHPGTPVALFILCAAMPEPRGGGDLDIEGEDARTTIGRWAGDRIAIVGDYAEDADLPESPVPASELYGLCHSPEDGGPPEGAFTDISEMVCRVIEVEMEGRFQGDGWRRFVQEAAQ
jgi:hypothetical protein